MPVKLRSATGSRTDHIPLGALFLLLLLGLFSWQTYAASFSVADIAEKVGRATVVVKAKTSTDSVSVGSGLVVDPSGIVVTNLHVVAGATRIQIRFPSGDEYDVTSVGGIDETRDVAILKIPGFDLPVVTLGNSNKVKAGHRIVVIGTALGFLENTVTTGIISGIRQLEGYRLFQMDAAVSPGNSGGPVANDQGQVIGVTVAKLSRGESLNFAVPINYARGLLQVKLAPGLKKLASVERVRLTPPDQDQSSNRQYAQQIPTRWRSLDTGVIKLLDQQGDFLTIQNEYPPGRVLPGTATIAQLKRHGNRWVGRVISQLVCLTPRQEYNTCHFSFDMEITTITPSQIEGSAVVPPPGAVLDCRRCSYSYPLGYRTFVWRPE
jgi:S1-C subfamily serine protease